MTFDSVDDCSDVAGSDSQTPIAAVAAGTPESVSEDATAVATTAATDSTESLLPEKEERQIELRKDENGLGITVAGYICEKGEAGGETFHFKTHFNYFAYRVKIRKFSEDLSGIFVKSVIEGSAADLSGQILVNDQIVAVSKIGFTRVFVLHF